MSKLKNLRDRLEKLPQLKKEKNLSSNFGVFTKKVAESKVMLTDSYRDMEYISKVFPDAGCEKKILPILKSSIKEAQKLYKTIEEDPQTVQKKASENSVVRLRDYATSANVKVRDIWSREITNNVTKWEKLAEVTQGLGAKGGREFKQAVVSLKNKKIPKSDEEVVQIKTAQINLHKGIANLGLEGPFGKFLEATVESRGASPKDLFKKEIKEKIEEFNLWDSFQIRLGQ